MVSAQELPAIGITDEMAALLKLAANPSRLRILQYLATGERAVAEIEQDLAIRQPTLSQQLGELRTGGVVATRREHKSVFYRLDDARMRGLLAALDDLFARPRQALPALRPAPKRSSQAAVFGIVGDPT